MTLLYTMCTNYSRNEPTKSTGSRDIVVRPALSCGCCGVSAFCEVKLVKPLAAGAARWRCDGLPSGRPHVVCNTTRHATPSPTVTHVTFRTRQSGAADSAITHLRSDSRVTTDAASCDTSFFGGLNRPDTVTPSSLPLARYPHPPRRKCRPPSLETSLTNLLHPVVSLTAAQGYACLPHSPPPALVPVRRPGRLASTDWMRSRAGPSPKDPLPLVFQRYCLMILRRRASAARARARVHHASPVA
eukprot:5118456-Prymnesium_polylepis.2